MARLISTFTAIGKKSYKLRRLHVVSRRLFGKQKGEREFDLCIIGCGGGGFAAAARAWDYGKKVAIISPNVGGATIHNGALSSKVNIHM